MDGELVQGEEVIALWPDGPPQTIEGVGREIVYASPEGLAAGTAMVRNVTEATLTVFRPSRETANGVGVVICPGGGWRILAWTHEGLDLARWLAARGYTAFVLKYRLMGTPEDPGEFAAAGKALAARVSAEPIKAAAAPRSLDQIGINDAVRYARSVAAADGRRAVALVRERAATWGLRPNAIGILGFSAGAFLAVDVAMDPGGPPLAFVAPIYGGDTLGRPVAADAPPLFAVVASDDRRFYKMVEALYAQWSDADRPAELHIFGRGGHGFGTVRQGFGVDRWVDLLADWLAERGLA